MGRTGGGGAALNRLGSGVDLEGLGGGKPEGRPCGFD